MLLGSPTTIFHQQISPKRLNPIVHFSLQLQMPGVPESQFFLFSWPSGINVCGIDLSFPRRGWVAFGGVIADHSNTALFSHWELCLNRFYLQNGWRPWLSVKSGVFVEWCTMVVTFLASALADSHCFGIMVNKLTIFFLLFVETIPFGVNRQDFYYGIHQSLPARLGSIRAVSSVTETLVRLLCCSLVAGEKFYIYMKNRWKFEKYISTARNDCFFVFPPSSGLLSGSG